MKAIDITNQIFDKSKGNTGWDQTDDFAIQLYNPTLLIDIGNIKAGTKVKCGIVNFTEGTIYVLDEKEKVAESAIKVSVEPLTED